jgi:hypothetical protein
MKQLYQEIDNEELTIILVRWEKVVGCIISLALMDVSCVSLKHGVFNELCQLDLYTTNPIALQIMLFRNWKCFDPSVWLFLEYQTDMQGAWAMSISIYLLLSNWHNLCLFVSTQFITCPSLTPPAPPAPAPRTHPAAAAPPSTPPVDVDRRHQHKEKRWALARKPSCLTSCYDYSAPMQMSEETAPGYDACCKCTFQML